MTRITDKDSKFIPEGEQAFLIVPLCVMNNKFLNVKFLFEEISLDISAHYCNKPI